jgi:hypothetical protein
MRTSPINTLIDQNVKCVKCGAGYGKCDCWNGHKQQRPLERLVIPQRTLFGLRTIRSASFDEQELIESILYLHCDGKPIECDPTYSIGNFYKGRTKPKYKYDIKPQTKEVTEASADNLPLPNNSISVLMFDPPFIFKDRPTESRNKIQKRFSYFKTWDEMIGLYDRALKEFARIVEDGGTVIFKCQDVCDGLNYFTHCKVMDLGIKNGFYPKDLFVLIAKNREDLTNYNGGQQRHARKYHCYFWVFKKTKCKVNYGQDEQG